jgi:ParB family chromosome partitioning protein
MPVELFELPPDRRPRHGEARYGIISGFRRIAAFRAQLADTRQDRYAAIPAFIRAPTDHAAALAAMVEENEIRAEITPWERGRVLIVARDTGAFASVEEAVDRLYPEADRMKKSRFRSIALVVEELQAVLTAPETLSQRQLMRLAQACGKGWGEFMSEALEAAGDKSAEGQWRTLQPILAELDSLDTRPEPGTEAPPPSVWNRGRPRRIVRLRQNLLVRREVCRDGYLLRFTGKEATGPMLDRVIEEIEKMYAPYEPPRL